MSKVTVTELSSTIAQAIKDNTKKSIIVVGEVSNPKVKGNHTYLTLKDAHSSIEVRFWGRQLKDSEIKHGDNVEITGSLNYYAPYGSMNFIGKQIEKVGIGSIHAQYEKTCQEYKKKGYFDNKKQMPRSIRNIGVVTAETGAALQDFIRVLRNNKFSGKLFVYDALVQGPRCPNSVAAGIKFFDSPFYVTIDKTSDTSVTPVNTNNKNTNNTTNTTNTTNIANNTIDVRKTDIKSDTSSDEESIDPFDPKFYTGTKNLANSDIQSVDSDMQIIEEKESIYDLKELDDLNDEFEQVEVDVVVITRGGGSFEDLMGFSHPTVLEAIYKSKRYTISSVGHEIDDMLSDFVANCSVGTPSMAGDIISKTCSDGFEKLHEIEKKIMRYRQDIMKTLYSIRQNVNDIERGLEDPIKKILKTIADIQVQSRDLMWKSLKRYSKKNHEIYERINQHDCTGLLKNGFSVLIDSDGRIIKDENKLFNQNIKLIHETGTYDIRISRI